MHVRSGENSVTMRYLLLKTRYLSIKAVIVPRKTETRALNSSLVSISALSDATQCRMSVRMTRHRGNAHKGIAIIIARNFINGHEKRKKKITTTITKNNYYIFRDRVIVFHNECCASINVAPITEYGCKLHFCRIGRQLFRNEFRIIGNVGSEVTVCRNISAPTTP